MVTLLVIYMVLSVLAVLPFAFIHWLDDHAPKP